MASMASRISGSTARRIAEKEYSSTFGSRSPLPAAKLADKAEAFGVEYPFMLLGNILGELTPEFGRELCLGPEYVRTTTGWLDTVVRLEVDFAALLL
jgi:hypothetical protein